MQRHCYKPIGIIHSPFKEPKGTPIQPAGAIDIEGEAEIFHEYAKGLKSLENFSHIILIYHFHLSKETSLEVKPFMDDHNHGVFATRAPSRPNPIGISTVELTAIENNTLFIKNIDIVDKTPLLDIKPYVPHFIPKGNIKIGWLESNISKLFNTKDDNRFKT